MKKPFDEMMNRRVVAAGIRLEDAATLTRMLNRLLYPRSSAMSESRWNSCKDVTAMIDCPTTWRPRTLKLVSLAMVRYWWPTINRYGQRSLIREIESAVVASEYFSGTREFLDEVGRLAPSRPRTGESGPDYGIDLYRFASACPTVQSVIEFASLRQGGRGWYADAARDIVPYLPLFWADDPKMHAGEGVHPSQVRHVEIRRAWQTPDVLAIASKAFSERRTSCVCQSGVSPPCIWCQGDGYTDHCLHRDTLMALSDAVQDAGCPHDSRIVSHLRSGGGHVLGCWAVDALLNQRRRS